MATKTTTTAARAAREVLEVAREALARIDGVLSDGVRYLSDADGEMATLGALANRERWLRDLGAMLDGACAILRVGTDGAR